MTKISRRELEVLKSISFGFTAKEIAQSMYLSAHTIISYRKRLYAKLDVKNSPELVRIGFQLGYLTVQD